MPDDALARCTLLDLPVIEDRRGNLTYIEGNEHVPFAIQRVYYLYDVPGGESRAGHAHRRLEQLLIAASGSFDVVVDNGVEQRLFTLNRSYFGLYLPPMLWREIQNFSSGAVCLALASLPYEESDYFRDYDDLVRARTA